MEELARTLKLKLDCTVNVLRDIQNCVLNFKETDNDLLREKMYFLASNLPRNEYVSLLVDLDKSKGQYGNIYIPFSAVKAVDEGKDVNSITRDLCLELRNVNLDACKRTNNINVQLY